MSLRVRSSVRLLEINAWPSDCVGFSGSEHPRARAGWLAGCRSGILPRASDRTEAIEKRTTLAAPLPSSKAQSMPTFRSAIRTALRNAVPASRRLGFDFRIARLTGRLEPELVHLARITGGGRTALDIGANQGLYSYALAGIFQRVLAFEPNSGVAEGLQRAAIRNLEVQNVALSAANGVRELYIPQVSGVQQHGWASFDQFNLPDATDVLALQVPVRTLDSYALEGVDFVKIDVEGHEPEVLAGAVDTLRRNRPTVLSEIRPANSDSVLAQFDSLGYTPYILRAGSLVAWDGKKDGDGENLVFKPARGQ